MKALLFFLFSFFTYGQDSSGLSQAVQNISSISHVASQATNAVNGCQKTTFTSKINIDPDGSADDFHKDIEFSLGRQVDQEKFQGDEVSVLTEEEAQKLFDLFSNIDYLKFDYLHDGCFARAHELALIAKENGIEMGKVFLKDNTGVASLYPESWKGDLNAPVPSGFVGWRYHVTPYVLVEKKGKKVPFVFDVGVAQKSQSLDEWQDSMMDRTIIDPSHRKLIYRDRGYIYEDGRSYFPDSSQIRYQLEEQSFIRENGIDEYLWAKEEGYL